MFSYSKWPWSLRDISCTFVINQRIFTNAKLRDISYEPRWFVLCLIYIVTKGVNKVFIVPLLIQIISGLCDLMSRTNILQSLPDYQINRSHTDLHCSFTQTVVVSHFGGHSSCFPALQRALLVYFHRCFQSCCCFSPFSSPSWRAIQSFYKMIANEPVSNASLPSK